MLETSPGRWSGCALWLFVLLPGQFQSARVAASSMPFILAGQLAEEAIPDKVGVEVHLTKQAPIKNIGGTLNVSVSIMHWHLEFPGEDGSKEVGMQHVQSHHQWEAQVEKHHRLSTTAGSCMSNPLQTKVRCTQR